MQGEFAIIALPVQTLTFRQIAAQTFIRDKEYGVAVSYCTSAEDWSGLGRVIDLVLEEYIREGKCPWYRRKFDDTNFFWPPLQVPRNLPHS